jgi:hypothetical protein
VKFEFKNIMDGLVDELDGPPKVINEDVAKLRQAWISEAACPEILPFDQSLVEGVNKCERGILTKQRILH